MSSGLNFGGSALVPAGGHDAFVASVDSSGVHRFSHNYGSANPDTADGIESGEAITTDAQGAVFVAGAYNGDAADFGEAQKLTWAGKLDVFVAKYANDGAHLWSKGYGGAGTDTGAAVRVGHSLLSDFSAEQPVSLFQHDGGQVLRFRMAVH
jgi:hypothetical protein